MINLPLHTKGIYSIFRISKLIVQVSPKWGKEKILLYALIRFINSLACGSFEVNRLNNSLGTSELARDIFPLLQQNPVGSCYNPIAQQKSHS